MKKKLIMVLGVQRSGTTALFNSLAHAPNLTPLNESADDAVYYQYRLRPLAEIAPVLEAARGAVLLKPLSETFYRSLEELAAEYRNYDLRMVWIYRDPVNVLYSMHRQGWVAYSQIDHAQHLSPWVRRNRLALRFQQLHPNQIALVRYEDCSADPLVFRQLAAWLQVEGRSLFREESAQGRRRLPRAAQAKIDAAARPTLNALDAARTFRPRPLARAKRFALNSLTRWPEKLKRWAQGGRQDTAPEWDAAVFAATPALPSSVAGLQFWLDAAEKFSAGPEERGPRRQKAQSELPAPFHLPFLNGKYALFFPREKALARRQGPAGILRFDAPEVCSFLFESRSFSVFVLFKPQIPMAAPNDQRRAVVLRLGPPQQTPAFILEWDRQTKAPKAILLGPQTAHRSVVTAAPGTHPHQKWRVVHFQKNGNGDTELSLSVNGFAGGSVASVTSPSAPLRGPVCTLQLGGDAAQRDALFFGAIAEVMIFDRALATAEHRGIIRFLKEKYLL